MGKHALCGYCLSVLVDGVCPSCGAEDEDYEGLEEEEGTGVIPVDIKIRDGRELWFPSND